MKQAMIFAAGLGTRLKPLTDTMPKALVPVGGRPLLEHVILRLKEAGYSRIVVNVHHFADQIVNHLLSNDNYGLDIRISDERDCLLETGGGIKKALSLLDTTQPVLIHNVDILSNAELSVFGNIPSEIDACLLVSKRETSRYLLFNEEGRLKAWTNVKTGEIRSPYEDCGRKEDVERQVREGKLTPLAFSGIHMLSPSVYPLFAQMPDRFGIMDFYLKHCHQHVFQSYMQPGLRLLDVGKTDSLTEAEQFLENV